MVFVRFAAGDVIWSRDPETFASSNLVERGFRQACGTPLTDRRIGGPDVSVTRHSLDDPGAVPAPEVSNATACKAAWLADLDGLPDDGWDLTRSPGFISHQGTGTPGQGAR